MKHITLTFIFLFFPIFIFASGGNPMVELMTNLVLQLGIILFVAKFSGLLFEKLKMPSVIGELVAGIIIGPFLLGGISFPGFPEGIFPIQNITFPITTELYGIATVASIILLFHAGLETNLGLFLQYSLAGSLVGIGGIVFSFGLGVLTGVYFFGLEFMDPKSLFLGVMSTATSVGITARILSEKHKMDSPEGVTILSGAVIDDVLGIIILAVVLGISEHHNSSENIISWKHISFIALKAIFVWLGFTVLGLFSAFRISKFLKRFKSKIQFSILAFGIALIISGIFEKAGLAMIIGAYVAGLTLSKTDINYVIQENLHSIQSFFVPIFFTVMGMLVNLKILFSVEVLSLGAIYTLGAIFAKIVGCGLPAKFLNFNLKGAWRIGLGMIPRGEVALIIAGIGLSQGIIDEKIFGVAILMTLITTIVSPPLLSNALKNSDKGTIKDLQVEEKISTSWNFPSEELTYLLLSNILGYFQEEGYFINSIKVDSIVYHIRKNNSFIQLHHNPKSITVKTDLKDVMYIKTIVYESLVKLHNTFDKLKNLAKPEKMKKNLFTKGQTKVKSKIIKFLDKRCIITNLNASTKELAIKQLIHLLYINKHIKDEDTAYKDVIEREKSMSTGFPNGIAIPHARTEGSNNISLAIGISKKGIDFKALDNKMSKVIFLLVSTKDSTSPHIKILAEIASLAGKDNLIDNMTKLNSAEEIYDLLKNNVT